MEQNELGRVVGADETDVESNEAIDEEISEQGNGEEDENDTVLGDNVIKAPLWQSFVTKLPRLAIWTRYLLPLVSLLVLFVMTFFYNVTIYGGGAEQELSVFRLYVNTFKGMRAYFGGATATGRSWFYGIVTAGAVVGILGFLLALFLKGLAAYTAAHAFLAGHESEKSDKMKLAFKIAFPGRVWLFLSDLLILFPLLYPHFFSIVSRNFLTIGGEEVIFILLDRSLIVGGILVLLNLILAILIPKHERRQKMNMFLLHRTEDHTTQDGQTDTKEEETE